MVCRGHVARTVRFGYAAVMSEARISTPAKAEVLSPETSPSKRTGRPPGYPKTGGRKPGVPNKTPALAQALAGKAAPDAMRLLVMIMKGQRVAHRGGWWEPEPHQRLSAATTILKKSVPDVGAVQLSGPAGEPISISINVGRSDAD